MENERIDLSALDPSRDRERWDWLVDSIAERAVAVRRRRLSVTYQLRAWARPALVLAAAAAVVALVGTQVGLGSTRYETVATTTTQQDPAVVLANWARTDNAPTTAAILDVLGGYDARE